MSTNLPRITQKIFAQNAAEDDLLQFGSVLSGNATPSTSIAETQTTAYQTGWRSAVISDRNYPTLGEMNAVQQVPTQQLAYLFQKGIGEWDAGTTYYANVSYCQVNGVLYQSVSDNNIGNNPTTDNGTNWIIADLSNKITNCILSAPNGVATYSGNTITVKQGLKALLMNGRNTDNSLNNIEYTVSADISREFDFATSTTALLYLLIDSNGAIGAGTLTEDDTVTIPSGVSFNLNSNLNYIYALSDTSPKARAILGKVQVTNGNITAIFPYQPVELVKRTDLDKYNVAYIVESFINESNTSGYILYSNKYCVQWGIANATGNRIIYLFKEYVNKNYIVMAITNDVNMSYANIDTNNSSFTTSQIYIKVSDTSRGISNYWITFGYIS